MLVLALALTLSCKKTAVVPAPEWVAMAPAGDAYCVLDPTGTSIIPNGRLITPRGKTLRIAPHPYGLILSKDGSIAITANSGNRPFSISILEDLLGTNPRIRQIPEKAEGDDDLLKAVFMGLAISPDNKLVYVAGGQENKVFIFDIQSGAKKGEINCAYVDAGRDYTHGYLGDLTLSADGKRLFVVDQIGFRVVIVNTETRKVLQSIPVGRYPFGITLSPDEKELYVANVGVFAYTPFPDVDPNNLKGSSHAFPAFPYNSKEMREGIKNDSVNIPGLGDPNAPESFSVWTISLDGTPVVTHKTKTGFLVGQMVEGIPAVGGASPNSIVATDRYVFVSNGNNDCISVIDTQQDTVVKNIALQPDPRLGTTRGVIPFGLALSPDKKRLFVAESGINAVGVIDVASMNVLGHIPVGWFPSKLSVHPDGKHLIVANAKGYGSGPNGGANFKEGPEGTYVGNLMKGSVSIMEIPGDAELAATSQQVIQNNFNFVKPGDKQFADRKNNPIPLYPGEKVSPIKYIVFVSKENRTYDEVFGQVAKGKGDPSMARYGLKATFKSRRRQDSVANSDVMINHLALAQRFAISDNFYVDSDHSADGHRWLVSTYPNEWVETAVAAAYGGKRNMKADSKAPGNFSFVGASGSIYPEDYNEHGSLWDHLHRNNKDFFNFGFGVEMAAAYDDSTLKKGGVRYLVNYPLPGPLFDRTSRSYATYNMAIPDQYRVDVFMQEFKEKWMGQGKTLPQVLTVILPNDHGAGERPHAGYPYRESYMMDNDLALGRLVEFLSNTPYWKNMAIVVTEDDAQDGKDHVDAHRSILMVISPYAKKNHVSHTHSSFGSIFKTFWNILGIPHLNQYDAGASDLFDCFTATPDFTPYKAIPVNPLVFDPQKALTPFDEKFDWKALGETPKLDDVEDFIKMHSEKK